MRLSLAFAAIAAVSAAFVSASIPAQAGGLSDHGRSDARVNDGDDPYAYVPKVPRYYGYRNSGYFVPTADMRHRYRRDLELPEYEKSWGWNSKHWYDEHGDERRRFSRDPRR